MRSGKKSSRGGGVAQSDRLSAALMGIVAGLSALRPTWVFRHIGLRGGIKQRHYAIPHRLDPIGRSHPPRAVPLLNVGDVMPIMVVAGDLQWRAETLKSKLLPARRRDVERLQPTDASDLTLAVGASARCASAAFQGEEP